MFKDSKIYVAGDSGLLGSALVKLLRSRGCGDVLTASHAELDLCDAIAVDGFFAIHRPEYVFLAAGKVGGIVSNKAYPADYLSVNLLIQTAVFGAAQKYGVRHLVFYGSSCMYPKASAQPIVEGSLFGGAIEETSIGYATAKMAGIVGCEAYNRQYDSGRFIALVPNSMYGAGDNFELGSCHVLSALIRRFHEAKVCGADSVELWGSGEVRREFVFSEDVAAASVFAVENAGRLENRHYNVGSCVDCTIRELAETVAGVVGFEGELLWDLSKPDGVRRKLLDSSDFMSLGWKAEVGLLDGLQRTYDWYRSEVADV